IDTANSDGGSWPAGVASPTYASMERRGVTADVLTSWSTYADTNPSTIVHDHDGNIVKGTPGKANWGPTVTLTPSPVPTATEKVRPPTPIPPTPFAHVVINEFLPRAGFDWNND
ncbi:MAG: hypothetical protein M1485_05135, partial [Chloroflexi bacterium]|nr:hypothetical protein [Chloroflexota bacterium]